MYDIRRERQVKYSTFAALFRARGREPAINEHLHILRPRGREREKLAVPTFTYRDGNRSIPYELLRKKD